MDAFLPKVEATDSEQECYRMARLDWNSGNTMRLIEKLERECHELWNMKHPGYKNRTMKQLKFELLADMFGTTVEEITRKVHNLRTQFNNELRKIKKRQETGEVGGSGWEYFDALSFLKIPDSIDKVPDPLELDAVNLEVRLKSLYNYNTYNTVYRKVNIVYNNCKLYLPVYLAEIFMKYEQTTFT